MEPVPIRNPRYTLTRTDLMPKNDPHTAASSLRAWLHGENHREAVPSHGDSSFIKFPEVLQLLVQGGLGNLLRELDFRATMPMSPPGDPFTGCRSAFSTVISQARVNIGRWRRLIFPAL